MMKHLLTTAAVTLAVTNAGLAQQAPQTAPVQTREQPAQAQQQAQRPAEGGARGIIVRPDGEQHPAQPEAAQEEQPAAVEAAGEPFITAQEVGQVRADRVLGRGVVNPQQEEVGEINDLVFDENGRLVAAVIGVGGFLGLADKDVAVSWDRIEWTPREDGEVELSIPFTREQLERAPEFKDLAAQQMEAATAAQRQLLQRLQQLQQPAGAPGGMAPAPSPAAPPAQQ